MRFWLGLIIGAALGGTGVYLGLERPWAGAGAEAEAPDAGAVAKAEPKKGNKRRRGKRRRGKRQTETTPLGDDIPTLTAADRAMVWRGDAVALPKREIDFEGGDGRPLDGGEINAILARRSGAMIDCIKEARGNAELKAKIQLEMLVDGDGRVIKSRVRAPNYLFDHGFAACARSAARGIRFPATGAHTVVKAPYDLF